MPDGEEKAAIKAFFTVVGTALSGKAVAWPGAEFDPEKQAEYVEVRFPDFGGGGGRSGERKSSFTCEFYCVAKDEGATRDLGAAYDLAELLRAGLEDQDIAVGTDGIIRLGKLSVESTVEAEGLHEVRVMATGTFQRA